MQHSFCIDYMLADYDSVLLVAQDAGAAVHIASWFSTSKKNLSLYAKGPAERLFLKVFDQKSEKSLSSAIAKSSLVVTGTGWTSDLEHRARCLAFTRNIPSVGVLDHWVNYLDRFERDGKLQLPGELWVSDAEAVAIASVVFPKVPIRQFPNLWLKELCNNVNSIRNKSRRDSYPFYPAKRLLYFLEPIRTSWSNNIASTSEAGEFQALRYWLNQLPQLIDQGIVACADELEALHLRLHPSEPIGKYDTLISDYSSSWPIRLETSVDLAESLAWADAAFGCETQALVAAMSCGIPAFSTIPPWAPPCRLPQASLNHLSCL